ncbi:hypothetical protein D3C78_1659130 [compost metagenome]
MFITQVATAFSQLAGEGCVGVELALACGDDVLRREPGFAGKQGVCRQAVVATVDL